jgi:hypothetical protein
MDLKEVALEFVKIYYSCHPDKLPDDKEKAYTEMSKLHGQYKEKLIKSAQKKSEDFFSDRF